MSAKPIRKLNPKTKRSLFSFEWRGEAEKLDFLAEMEKEQKADPRQVRSLVDYIRLIHEEHKKTS